MKSFSIQKALFLFSVVFLLLAGPICLSAQDWLPVTPEELALKKPVVEPDADAEALFWEVRIDDSNKYILSRKHYVRVKIFTERGRERYSKFDVHFTKGWKIKDLSARVIRADGSIVEIQKADIFEREVVKEDGLKIKAKSFAIPNIEPGVIVEYTYVEEINDASAMGTRLIFQRDIPVQKISYFYKPFNSVEPKGQPYNFADTKFVKDKNGYWLASRTNVAALKEEPQMPPEDMVRAWMLLTGAYATEQSVNEISTVYSVKDPSNPSRYWASVSGERAAVTKLMNKGGGDIKKTAADIVAGASTPDDKLKKLYEFCQTQIENTSFTPGLTKEQRDKLPATKSAGDVLQRKSGSSQFIGMLFGALASASGFETRIAYTGDRSKMIFNPETMVNDGLIHPAAVAVKVGDGWQYFNPGIKFLPYGMLPWNEQDTFALLVGENRFEWNQTPFSGHEVSLTKRSARFQLLDDGTLEGDVTIELNGQPGLAYRLENFDVTTAKVEENLKQEIKRQFTTAEVSDVSIGNMMDGTKPLVQKYRVRVPNYAQKTGRRIFLQPNFFKFGASPMFSGSTRKYDIFFRYPWSETDDIEITWPAGFELDNADAPAGVADSQKIGSLDIRISADREKSNLKYSRKFHFGGGGNILFNSAMYSPLKNLFDEFNKADAHMVTLKVK